MCLKFLTKINELMTRVIIIIVHTEANELKEKLLLLEKLKTLPESSNLLNKNYHPGDYDSIIAEIFELKQRKKIEEQHKCFFIGDRKNTEEDWNRLVLYLKLFTSKKNIYKILIILFF